MEHLADMDHVDHVDHVGNLGDTVATLDAHARMLSAAEVNAPLSLASARTTVGLDLFTEFPFADLDRLRGFAGAAAAAGYAGVLSTENRHDPFLPIAAAASKNLPLTFGTAVVTVLAHNPFTLAQKSWDLHYNTGERFVLGICAHQNAHLVHRLGISAECKHERVTELVAALREIWTSWKEQREPHFNGRYHTIDSCPEGYRPTTRIETLPRIYLLCAELSDVDIAPQVADGIFTHPTWNRAYLETVVLPRLELRRSPRSSSWLANLPVVDGSVVATGETVQELSESRGWARQRIAGYWLQTKYDVVYDALGLRESIRQFRAAAEAGTISWDEGCVQQLYEQFVCDSPFDDLAARLRRRHSAHTTGLFPNVMSAVPRLLPADLVNAISTCRQ